MREAEAVAMLAKGVPSLEIGPARDLARRLGEWPLALELALAMMRERVREGEPAGQVATRLLTIIERKGVRALQDPAAGRRHRTVTSVLEVSLELLDAADRRRLSELSIFPEDVAIPLGAAASVWELDEWDAEDLAHRLARALSAETRSRTRRPAACTMSCEAGWRRIPATPARFTIDS